MRPRLHSEEQREAASQSWEAPLVGTWDSALEWRGLAQASPFHCI
jgi:hypothetical protein